MHNTIQHTKRSVEMLIDQEAVEALDQEPLVDRKALDPLRNVEGVHFLQTWITLGSILDDLATEGDETLRQRLRARDGYATLYIFKRIFGEEMVKTVTDSLEENPTFNICQRIADEIKRILGDKRVDQLSEDEREAIRSKIEFFEHGEHWYWNTYIRPVRKTLGEAAVHKIDLVLERIIESKENFQDHILVIEHELVRAMEEFEEGWTDENIHSQVDLGHNIQLWTHETAGQKILVVPSFFCIVAENTSFEHKMNTVYSMIQLLVHLLEVEMIDDERFDRELDLLLRLSMQLEEDSVYEARTKFLPLGYCQGPPKNNRNVFGNIATFGIPTAIGQALAHLLH